MATETDILIIGGGPVGMMAAYMFAQRGQKSTLIEQSKTTTVHPKMEFTNSRSMEIHRRIGTLERVKAKSVPESYDLNELISTGYGEDGLLLHTWVRESPAELREKWAKINDGSSPLEPYMREHQITFEALLKKIIQSEPLIDDHWGYKFRSHEENNEVVLTTVIDPDGKEMRFKSKYLIGCDGAGSAVRKSADIKSPRRTLPLAMLSTHFKSKDLGRILTEQGQGHFWHAVFLNGAVIVNQDEGTEWTVVQTTPHDADLKAVLEAMDPPKFIYGALGGIGKPYEFEIDEMLTKYVWKADLAIADSFRSSKGRVFLAGDAAHQITPVGGHGMNSGVQDVYDLTWKLDAVLRGYGGDTLLDSYTFERRKIAELNVSQAEKGAMELMLPMFMNAAKYSPEQILAQNQEGEEIRKELKAPMENGHWLHNQNGIILGYRYNGSPILVPDSSPEPPESSVTEYTPTTWPGSRAPHVFLNDGKTSVFDLYGSGFTIVDFSPKGETSDMFGEAASSLDIPISKLHLPEEKHCRQVWERDVVLVRPDGVVAWRVPEGGNWQADKEAVTSILRTAVGKS